MKPIRLIVVDDHELVREGIRHFLDSKDDLDVLAEGASGREAIDLVAEFQPDIVLMDLQMKDLDGVEATQQIKENYPEVKVVILTSYHDDEFIFPALRAGALSYILKDLNPEGLVEAVRAAARGEAVLNPQVAARVLRESYGPKDLMPNVFTELTKRELEILKLIADGKNNALIAQELDITEGTVKGHVTNILSKLNVSDRTQAAVFAWREGVVKRN